MRAILFLATILLAACSVGESDSSLYLTGTEEGALTTALGAKECMGKKVLVCHVPPGNPANAHTICVGEPAADPHVAQHGDTLGACATEPSPPPEEPPPPDEPPTEPPPPEPTPVT
ncbi:MAG: hypothetical protein WKG01_01160 [Kofleriaceae bacterium]